MSLPLELSARCYYEHSATANFDLDETGGKYLLELENGVLNHTVDMQSDNADATVTLTRDTLNNIILQQTKLADAISGSGITTTAKTG